MGILCAIFVTHFQNYFEIASARNAQSSNISIAKKRKKKKKKKEKLNILFAISSKIEVSCKNICFQSCYRTALCELSFRRKNDIY
jgi:hypothetical protein